VSNNREGGLGLQRFPQRKEKKKRKKKIQKHRDAQAHLPMTRVSPLHRNNAQTLLPFIRSGT
jgi:hypothetical protein